MPRPHMPRPHPATPRVAHNSRRTESSRRRVLVKRFSTRMGLSQPSRTPAIDHERASILLVDHRGRGPIALKGEVGKAYK